MTDTATRQGSSGGYAAGARTVVRVLLSHAEGNSVAERAFLDSRQEIRGALDQLDLATPLCSAEARAIGADWADLFRHVLARGVQIHLVLNDHDPFMAPAQHEAVWAAHRRLTTLAQEIGAQGRLHLAVLQHPARMRLLPRLSGWALRRREIAPFLASLAALPEAERTRRLADLPGLAPILRRGADGSLNLPALPPALPAAQHRQRFMVFDRKHLFLGGIEAKPADQTGIGPRGLRLSKQGPVVPEALAHLEAFAEVTRGLAEPPSQRRLLRTLSRPSPLLTLGNVVPVSTEIATAHETLARRAEQLIYIETRRFDEPRFARRLAEAGRDMPSLNLILLLPEAASASAAEREILGRLRHSFQERLFIGLTPASCDTTSPAADLRVSIFDVRAAILSSADLTTAALYRDTQTGLFLRTARDVDELRRRAMGSWLPRGATAEFYAPDTAVSRWRAEAEANARTPAERRTGRLLPYSDR